MFEIKNNEKRKYSVINSLSLSGALSEPIISAESKRDPRLIATQSPRMTEKALSFLRLCCESKKQKESSLILRKAKFQAIFEFVLSSASGGAGGGKYKRISAFVSMLVLLIRRSREKFFKKNFRDDRLFLGFAKVLAFAFLLSLNLSTAFADCNCDWGGADGKTLTITGCSAISESSCADKKGTANNIIIGTGVTSIGQYAFEHARSLTSITIPKGVTSIGDCAFKDASSLTSITIPEGVTSIGDEAFAYATGLTSITIPEGVTSIGNYAFDGTSSLTSITIPDSVTSIGMIAFRDTSSLTSITIPDSVTSIGGSAFWNATGLTSITIPEGVTSIGSYAFQDASSLESIIIPDNINTADWSAEVFGLLPEDTNIVCQGELKTCYEKLAKYIPESKGGNCTNSDFCIKKEIQPAQSSQCNGSYIYENDNCHKRNEEQCNATDKYYYNGATCLYRPRNRQVTCVNPNYKANDGYCDRLRYTPAEAAQVLRDDNTNSVTITFKM